MTSPPERPSSAAAAQDGPSIADIKALLREKNDTKRFVGLALLRSVLDHSKETRENEHVVQDLWASISPRFLDRLLRTGSSGSSENSRDMLSLVVSVLHTFSMLLPVGARSEPKFVDRVPGLVEAVLQSSGETATLLLQLLHTIVSSERGATAFVEIGDLSPLTEIAPSHPMALDILRYAWLNSMTFVDDRAKLGQHVDTAIQGLVSSFTGTDAVTLLEFLGDFLRQAYSAIIPENPPWLKAVVGYIHNLVSSRPTPEARSAYTNAAASLLQVYPTQTPQLLFTSEIRDNKAFAYLFVNLLLIDIRSSLPLLLEQLNSPQYPKISRRLASSLDIISIFIGYLVRSLEDESVETFVMPPDSLLKLRKGLGETMSVTGEYLRDRWDAAVAGAMGLHPGARASTANTSLGSRYTLAWDSIKDDVHEDPLILSSIRTLALWLREDENDSLRKEATGLTDMFLDLYKSKVIDKNDFRSPVLVAFEALVTLDRGREILLSNDGWQILSRDLLTALQESASVSWEDDIIRGQDIVRVLLPISELEGGGTQEEWMNLITNVAAWDVPTGQEPAATMREFHISVLTLCCSLLSNASAGMRQRYVHSISAIRGIAQQLSRATEHNGSEGDALGDVLSTLSALEL